MYNIFVDWIGETIGLISDDLIYAFACVASLLVLSFLFDFFKFIMYYITRR